VCDALVEVRGEFLSPEEFAALSVVVGEIADQVSVTDAFALGGLRSTGRFAFDGFRSPGSWLAHYGDISRGQAGARLKRQAFLDAHREVADLLAAGSIGSGHVRVLERVDRGILRESFARDAAMLAGLAPDLGAADFGSAVEGWAQLALHELEPDPTTLDFGDDYELDDQSRQIIEGRNATLIELEHSGVFELSGQFTPEAGALISEVIDTITDRMFRADWDDAKAIHGDQTCGAVLARTPTQRRHDAIVEAITTYHPAPSAGNKTGPGAEDSAGEAGDEGTQPGPVGPSRPHTEVVVDLMTLLEGLAHETHITGTETETAARPEPAEPARPEPDGSADHDHDHDQDEEPSEGIDPVEGDPPGPSTAPDAGPRQPVRPGPGSSPHDPRTAPLREVLAQLGFGPDAATPDPADPAKIAHLASTALGLALTVGIPTGAFPLGTERVMDFHPDSPKVPPICELADGTPITPRHAARIALAGTIAATIFGGRHTALDAGAKQRLYTGRVRKAITIRDRTCTRPGCHAPARRCDIDHLQPHHRDGQTTEANGHLYCGFHHRQRQHHPPFDVGRHPTDGTITHTRPDGTQLE